MFFLVMRAFKLYPLIVFQVYNIVLITVTLLYISTTGMFYSCKFLLLTLFTHLVPPKTTTCVSVVFQIPQISKILYNWAELLKF